MIERKRVTRQIWLVAWCLCCFVLAGACSLSQSPETAQERQNRSTENIPAQEVSPTTTIRPSLVPTQTAVAVDGAGTATPSSYDAPMSLARDDHSIWQTYVTSDVLTLEPSPYEAHLSIAQSEHAAPVVAPLQPLTLTLSLAGYNGDAEVRVYDSQARLATVVTTTLHNGLAHLSITPGGWLGRQTAIVVADGKLAGVIRPIFVLQAETDIHTGLADIDSIYPRVRAFMQHDVVSYTLDGQHVRGYRSPDNPLLWLRDHVYQGRGFRYFEQDVTSLLNAFRRAQYPDGHFPDVLTYPELEVEAHRLETESDLEYLFVQGVYEAWQATGDDTWLRTQLDAMERGITYITSDPLRWDTERKLVLRPYTIDTWDFQYGPTTRSPDGKLSPRHWIDDQTIWGIFHGDNTGLAYALKLLENIHRYLGNTEEVRRLHSERDALMERLHRISWNGPFFTHFVLPDGSYPQVAGVDTRTQLSLSNALALNRDVLSFEQCRSILETYHKRRDFERAFAEWYSIDPPFPMGSFGLAGKKGERPGEYVNGGIMPLVGGELSRGAFRCGAEEYGFDILQRYAELIRLTGATYLWYYPDGRPGISGKHTLSTDGWGSSAMLGALIEGAAGVVDQEALFRDLSLNPRWAALPESKHVRVVVRYAASDGYVAYRWSYDAEAQRVRMQVTGSWDTAHVRLLLPYDGRDTTSRTLRVNGHETPFSKKKIGGGQYIIFDVEGGNATIELTWTT